MDEQLAIAVEDPLWPAIIWSITNESAYAQVVEWAREDIAHGSQPSMKLYGELLRRPHFANRLRLQASDEAYLINNNLLSLIARLVMRDHPEIVFPTRFARADLAVVA